MIEYSCPDCGTTNQLHRSRCEFENVDWYVIEKTYIDIVSVVIGEASKESAVTKQELKNEVDGKWGYLYGAVYNQLLYHHRITETEYGTIVPVDAATRKELLEPTTEPIQTLWEYGSVPGCHDNTIFALISWHEMNGFSWNETRERLLTWFEQTGTWERGGFEEPSPQELIDSKKHVYDEGYGWKEKANAARNVIRQHRK